MWIRSVQRGRVWTRPGQSASGSWGPGTAKYGDLAVWPEYAPDQLADGLHGDLSPDQGRVIGILLDGLRWNLLQS